MGFGNKDEDNTGDFESPKPKKAKLERASSSAAEKIKSYIKLYEEGGRKVSKVHVGKAQNKNISEGKIAGAEVVLHRNIESLIRFEFARV